MAIIANAVGRRLECPHVHRRQFIPHTALGIIADVSDKSTGFADYCAASNSPFFLLLEDSFCRLQGVQVSPPPTPIRCRYHQYLQPDGHVGAPDKRSTRSALLSFLEMNVGGGDNLSLNDLQNGIFRGNRPP